jgi:hypothetical protein
VFTDDSTPTGDLTAEDIDAYSAGLLVEIAELLSAHRPALSRRIRTCAAELQHRAEPLHN